jgi:hypothetical protein
VSPGYLDRILKRERGCSRAVITGGLAKRINYLSLFLFGTSQLTLQLLTVKTLPFYHYDRAREPWQVNESRGE